VFIIYLFFVFVSYFNSLSVFGLALVSFKRLFVVKIVPNMTYNVFGGMINPTLLLLVIW